MTAEEKPHCGKLLLPFMNSIRTWFFGDEVFQICFL